MKRISIVAVMLLLTTSPLGRAAETREITTKWTGWLSDEGCAAAKVKAEKVTPNGTTCVKKCLDEGATPVFVSPKDRAMYELKGYAALKEDVGYYLELIGVLDEETKTIAVKAAKRLQEIVNICGLPSKKK